MIDTQTIRKRILSLAMMGNLVEQNSSEGSALPLVEALSESLNGRPFQNDISEEEIPYKLPDSWVWCRLSDIGITNIGLTYHPQDVSEQGTTVIRSSNIVNGKMDYSDLVKVICPIRDNQYLNHNDIVICARNGSKALVGKCAIYEGKSQEMSFGAFMAIFRTPFFRYVYRYFNTPVFRRNFSNDDSKQINQVTQSILRCSLIPIPPEKEQNRIVDKIDSIFSLLDTIDTLQAQYRANQNNLRGKLIDVAIRGQLTEQLPEDGTAEELYQQIQQEKHALEQSGKIKKSKPLPPVTADEVPFDVPENWKWVRLGDISAKITSGNTPAGGKKSNAYVDDGYCFFREQNIYDDGIHIEGMVYISEKLLNTRENSTVLPKDILLNITGGSIGRCAIIPDDFSKGSINQHILIIRMIEESMRYFIHVILRSPYAQQYIKTKAVGDKDGFSGGRCKLLPIPLPPLAEQKRIVAKLKELLPLCE